MSHLSSLFLAFTQSNIKKRASQEAVKRKQDFKPVTCEERVKWKPVRCYEQAWKSKMVMEAPRPAITTEDTVNKLLLRYNHPIFQ